MGGGGAAAALVLAALVLAPVALPVPACRISEFPCRNSRCVRLDRYCDGGDDCGDRSDEPLYCTVCNRTYYGDVGKTYELELHKPREERLPFLCHLTFTANGLSHGDLVQLIFDAFNVGRYEPSALDGCPDGYMQLSELGRPFTGGSWCGQSTGHAVYYSETTTVTASVKLFPSPRQRATPLEFRLRYKFVSRGEAVVRFGPAESPLERGEVVPGTYCSRNFYECYRKRCRLQSPNYPGMYPRNVTCYLTVRQKAVPGCKHAMVAVRQESEHKMQIKRAVAVASLNKTGRSLRAWSDCTGERDHLIFYDGASTDDPVLVKFCGGDWLPRVVSRGPEMLVAFHSSPFSAPLHAGGGGGGGGGSPASPLRGFELDVDVVFSDSDSLDYSRDPRSLCEFWVNATSSDQQPEDPWSRPRGRAGHVLSPRHTLPPNTTCTYRFWGRPGDLVWLYFVSYSHQVLLPRSPSEAPTAASPAPADAEGDVDANSTASSCSTRLRIWDGGGPAGGALLGDHCDSDPPRLCDHGSLGNATRATRPCSARESYVSSGPALTVQHRTEHGTALHPAAFRLRYEFVDTRLGGEAWPARRGEAVPPSCSRVFRRARSGSFHSPRNVFLFGRGGAANLSCVYRLEAGSGEKIRLTLHNASFGDDGGGCVTEQDPHTGRPRCSHAGGGGGGGGGGRTAELRLVEVPWKDVRVARACLCDNSTLSATGSRHLVFLSSSRVLEVHFAATRLGMAEDYGQLYFHASWELVPAPDCPRRQRLRGSGGEVEFVSPPAGGADEYCEGVPWLVEAHENRSLFLLTWGSFLPLEPSPEEPARCPTKNRILLYSGRPARLMRVVCPAAPNARQFAVHVFSEEWFGGGGGGGGGGDLYLQAPRPPSFLVEFVGRDPGLAALNWLEISRSRASLLQQLRAELSASSSWAAAGNDSALPPAADWECPHRCPELNACISASLWCDGRANCPSGYDEAEPQCGARRGLLGLLPGGALAVLACGAAGLVALFASGCALLASRARARRRRQQLLGKKRRKKRRDGAESSGPRRVPTEELLLDPSGSTGSS
ncbi:uncharacterized protein LOC134536448 [Bacillus rossius redtenbacheri]|uniref:uncharacterized protein LOC134536448 n=1 Tax=Bacillus rossius redtenbacheri TaxID=93214 RepID=UPI002FDE9B63